MKKDKKKRVFTIIELMVIIMIVAIFTAVTVPILRGRIKQAKWSEESQERVYEEQPLTEPKIGFGDATEQSDE